MQASLTSYVNGVNTATIASVTGTVAASISGVMAIVDGVASRTMATQVQAQNLSTQIDNVRLVSWIKITKRRI